MQNHTQLALNLYTFASVNPVCVRPITLHCIVGFKNYFGINDYHDKTVCRVQNPFR